MTGIVIQTNGEDVLILTRNSAMNFSKSSILEIKPDSERVSSTTNRLSDFRKTLRTLGRQQWAENITPIPATVIEKGILRNVPYTSFRCADDYEVNIYGDLENPAGVEIGVYRSLLQDNAAKNNCIRFIWSLLNDSADQECVLGLDLSKDTQTKNELTFEITPPTAEDANNGWWVSVYSEKQLDLARASYDEIKQITMSKSGGSGSNSWSSKELKLARPSAKQTITFTTPSGVVVTNAEVVRTDGVRLTYKTGDTSGGTIQLSDLPEDLRNQLGYNEAQAKLADARSGQQQSSASGVAYGDDNAGYSGGGGRVYMRGYSRNGGNYGLPNVQASSGSTKLFQQPSSSPTTQAGYWLTTSRGKRHNSSCRYYGTTQGRSCGPNEGTPCKTCGG